MLMTTTTGIDMQFVRYEVEIGYFCRLHVFLRKVDGLRLKSGVDLLQWLSDKPFSYLHVLRGGCFYTRVMDFEVRQQTGLRHAFLPGWPTCGMLPVHPFLQAKYYVQVSGDWRLWEVRNKMCVLTPPVFCTFLAQ